MFDLHNILISFEIICVLLEFIDQNLYFMINTFGKLHSERPGMTSNMSNLYA